MLAGEKPRNDDMAAAHQLDSGICWLCLQVRIEHPVDACDPGTGRIHHRARVDRLLLPGERILNHTSPCAAGAARAHKPGPREDAGAVLLRAEEVKNNQPGIVHPGIRVRETARDVRTQAAGSCHPVQVHRLRMRKADTASDVVIQP